VYKDRCTQRGIERGELKTYKEAFLQMFASFSGSYRFVGNRESYLCRILQNPKSWMTGMIFWCTTHEGHFSDSVEVQYGTFTVVSTEFNKKDVKSIVKLHFNYRNYAWSHSRGEHREEKGEISHDSQIDLKYEIVASHDANNPCWSHSFPGSTRTDRVIMESKLSLSDFAAAQKKELENKMGSPWGYSRNW